MNMSQWERLITRAVNARRKLDDLVRQCELEYLRVFGNEPRPRDDYWIDLMDYGMEVDMDAIIRNGKETARE